MKRIFIILVVFTALAVDLNAQEAPAIGQLRAYLKTTSPGRLDSIQRGLTNRFGTNIHYLYPIYQSVAWDDHFKMLLGKRRYYQEMSVLMAEAGDYRGAADMASLSYDALPASNQKIVEKHALGFGNIQYVDAQSFILGKALGSRVVMMDENPAEAAGPPFLDQLLGKFYEEGFRYLAVQSLINNGTGSPLLINATTVTSPEPTQASMLRHALRLGFTLVPYEDSIAAAHSENERDSIRANNLIEVLKKDPTARMLVLGDYLSISKTAISDQYRPMAMQFRERSGIDPLTIEQAELTPVSTFEYGRLFYQLFTKRYVITEPSVLLEDRHPLNPLEETGFDIVVMHPPVIYTDGRPSWLTNNKDRLLTTISPGSTAAFFVQAYNKNDVMDDMTTKLIPADQTYYKDKDGNFPLYLEKGEYAIVVRDMNYRVLEITKRYVN